MQYTPCAWDHSSSLCWIRFFVISIPRGQDVDDELLGGSLLGSELSRLKKGLSVLDVTVGTLVTASHNWASWYHESSVSRCVEMLQAYTDHVVSQHNDAQKQIKHLSACVFYYFRAPNKRILFKHATNIIFR